MCFKMMFLSRQAADSANERLVQQKKYQEEYVELMKLLDELPNKLEHPIMVKRPARDRRPLSALPGVRSPSEKRLSCQGN